MSLDLDQEQDLEVHAYRPRSQIEQALIWGLAVLVLGGYLTATVRHSAGFVKRAFRLFCSGADSSASEEWKAVVHSRMLELRVSRMRVYLLLASGIQLPWYLALVAEVARGSFPRISTPASEISWLVFTAACTLVLSKPDLLTARNLDMASLCVVAHAVIQQTPFVCCTQEGFDLDRPFVSQLLVMGLCLVRGLGSRRETMVLALGNALNIGCMTYTRWNALGKNKNKQDQQDQNTPEQTEQTDQTETWGMLTEKAVSWVLLAALAMVLGAAIETGYRQLVTQGLQLAEAREMHKAATALLRSSHDVVVELDSSGSLDGDSQDLGSLLLRAPQSRSMRGVQLADLFVDEEDRSKFQRRLVASRTKSVGLAENMHVTMKDSLGNSLRMEMMWFACKRAEGGLRFIVGIRELWGSPSPSPSPSHSHSHSHSHSPSHNHGAADFFPFPAVTASPSVASSSSEGTASLPLSQSEYLMNVEMEQAVIVVDITQAGCPIRSTTTGFRTQVGYVPRNAPLSRLVKKPEPMMTWLQRAVNCVLNGVPEPEEHYKVSLRMPLGTMRARCRVVATEEDVEMPDVYVQNVLVLFSNITQCRSRHEGDMGGGVGDQGRGARGTPARSSPGPLGLLNL